VLCRRSSRRCWFSIREIGETVTLKDGRKAEVIGINWHHQRGEPMLPVRIDGRIGPIAIGILTLIIVTTTTRSLGAWAAVWVLPSGLRSGDTAPTLPLLRGPDVRERGTRFLAGSWNDCEVGGQSRPPSHCQSSAPSLESGRFRRTRPPVPWRPRPPSSLLTERLRPRAGIHGVSPLKGNDVWSIGAADHFTRVLGVHDPALRTRAS